MTNHTKQYYQKHAYQWIQSKTNSFHHEKQFLKFTSLLKPGTRVLDIGCAGGIHVPLFLGIGRKLHYTGIDVSRKMVAVAKRRYPQLKFQSADTMTYRTSRKFGGFWSAATLMHVPLHQWNTLLTQIENNMMSGAVGYISIPTERPNEATTEDQRHFSLLSKNEFRLIIKKRNWKLLHSGIIDGTTKTGIWNWYIIRLP